MTTTFTAAVTDQFSQPISSPTLFWSVTAGRINSQTGVFTPPSISEPCQVTVSSGGASLTQAVTIAASPNTAGRLGDDWIEPLFEQALGSTKTGSSVLAQSGAGCLSIVPTSASLTASTITAQQLHLSDSLVGPP